MKQSRPASGNPRQEKVMPQAVDAEKVILQEMMLNNPTISIVENILSPKDFYVPKHEIIYSACLQMYFRKEVVEVVALAEELKRMEKLEKIGGIPELMSIFSNPNMRCLNPIEYYSYIVKQKAVARRLIEICSDAIGSCFDESHDVSDVIEKLEIDLTQINNGMQTIESVPMNKAVDQTLKQIRETYENRQKGIISGIPTHLDLLTEAHGGGFKAPELIVLGARPSMGKTQHALEMAFAAGMNGCNTLFCSLEMNTSQLVKRLLLRDERISEKHINNGDLDNGEFVYLDESAGAIRPAKIFFSDNHNMRNLKEIKKEARRLKRKGLIKFLVIDYLGLIRTGLTFQLRVQEIAHITSELKALAKELDIAVLLLSQLSRPHKTMQGKIPVMEDLRESGDIEQDADIILLLHKPDYYDSDAVDSRGNSLKNRGMLIRAKCREGERNVVFEFSHDSRYKKISDYIPEKANSQPADQSQDKKSNTQNDAQQNLFNKLTDGETD
ncbi:hypothetical protein LJB92_01895 [Bacteroidales bacterium OttesenSCG-928-M06]|nr:hypothetical protein [Bacteroidales bacterium OttesenSCG-928-M06]